ncbi:helix-turn-helix transcriptional regulator [Streptomyces sp. NPDC029004]|uniref:helix-turn-helix domain-containing protein n=1 Tax=Streptomyces sp. NPDC029004 TaxID=3154490 RepID=UPI0033BFF158
MKNSKQQAGDYRPATFAAWLHEQLSRRGYDLSGPRSGGKSAFASASGISASTVGRLLRGDHVTDTRVLAMLANALNVPLGEVLVRAGVLNQSELQAVQHPPAGRPGITPEQAADELGITDEQSRRLFIAMTNTLQRQPPPNTGEADLAEQ